MKPNSLSRISHKDGRKSVQDGASDLFSPGREHYQRDMGSPGENKGDVADCANLPRECEKYGLVWMHKKGAEALEKRDFKRYREIEAWLSLPPCAEEHESFSNRFHYHLKEAGLFRKEHRFFYVNQGDKPSDAPWLNNAVYLDSIRSGFNVGSIVRTTEALRFGTLYFSSDTPPISHKKVKDAAMGSDAHVTAIITDNLDELPRPLIAVETVEQATPYHDFSFPFSGTLLLGNEEYGLSKASLEAADYYVSIPLFGTKNSLNVANAYAIIASHVSSKQRQLLSPENR